MSYTTKYFLKDQQLNFGDAITINGVKTIFTKQLLNDNPELFIISVVSDNKNIEEKDYYDVILGSNEVNFKFHEYFYYVDQYKFDVKCNYINDTNINVLKFKFKNTKVFKDKKSAQVKADDLFEKYSNHLINEHKTLFHDSHLLSSFRFKAVHFLQYVADILNPSEICDSNEQYIIMDDYSVDKVNRLCISDIVFYKHSDAVLAAKILKKYMKD